MSKSLKEEYKILKQIGKGTFAKVYKAKHKELGYIRALRVLNQTVIDENDPTYLKFLEECKLLLRLGNGAHPNIIPIAQPRLIGNSPIVEMAFIPGHDLYDFIVEVHKRFLPVTEVINMVKDISSALAYCHHDVYEYCVDAEEDKCVDTENKQHHISEQCKQELINKYKIIHNDIHSKNIVRKYDGSYILLDFGLAIISGEVIRSSKKNAGAMEYKPPEKWDDDNIVTEQSDIYSFGVLMYEALTGDVPFPLSNENSQPEINDLMRRHQKVLPGSVFEKRKARFEALVGNAGKEYVRDYPDWLEELILKCLEKDPSLRFSSGKALSDHLKSCLRNEAVDIEKPAAEGDDALVSLLIKETEIIHLKADIARMESAEHLFSASSDDLDQKIRRLENENKIYDYKNEKYLEELKAKNDIIEMLIANNRALEENYQTAKIEVEKKVRSADDALSKKAAKVAALADASAKNIQQKIVRAYTISIIIGVSAISIGLYLAYYRSRPLAASSPSAAHTVEYALNSYSRNALYAGLPATEPARYKLGVDSVLKSFSIQTPLNQYVESNHISLVMPPWKALNIVRQCQNVLQTATLPDTAALKRVISDYPDLRHKILNLYRQKIKHLLKDKRITVRDIPEYENQLRYFKNYRVSAKPGPRK